MEIKETFLYIKRHSITGLLYFGKTVKKNVYTYRGSGVYWKAHIKKHGIKFVETIWVSPAFTCKSEIEEFAKEFSKFFDIVNSDKWANVVIENGLDGGDTGVYPYWRIGSKDSYETKLKRANSIRGEKNGMYGKTGELNPFYGKTHSEETKIKLRMPKSEEAKLKFKQAIRPKCTCPHCGKHGHVPLMKRWHFDKCKHKID